MVSRGWCVHKEQREHAEEAAEEDADDARAHAHVLHDGEPALVHVDGVSAYELDSAGLIRRHRLESVVLNGPEAQRSEDLSSVTSRVLAWSGLAGGCGVPELAAFSSELGQPPPQP